MGGPRLLSGSPVGLQHQTAEVPAAETWILIRHYISQAGPLGRLRTMLEAVVKGLQETFSELLWARISRLDSAPLLRCEVVKAGTDKVHVGSFGKQCCD